MQRIEAIVTNELSSEAGAPGFSVWLQPGGERARIVKGPGLSVLPSYEIGDRLAIIYGIRSPGSIRANEITVLPKTGTAAR